jgi:methyltransferase
MMRAGGGPAWPLLAFLAFYALQRGVELVISARHERALRARGGREYGRGHYPWIVLLHASFPFAIAAEVLVLDAHPGRAAPVWFALWLTAQFMRMESMRTLGVRWTARVIVLPGEPPIRRGIYRWLRHPNYVAVATELLAAPLMLGAWRTAIAFTLADAWALRTRIRVEEHALASAATEPMRASLG